jgi:flagellum-specific ATP synthase
MPRNAVLKLRATPHLDACLRRVREVHVTPKTSGTVCGVSGGLIDARGLSAPVGSICAIGTAGRDLLAEVVALRSGLLKLAPFGSVRGLALGAPVCHRPNGIPVPPIEHVMGRVVDALGNPLDAGGLARFRPVATEDVLARQSPSLALRMPIESPMVTGVAAVDGLLTLGCGQRVGIFAGSGVGKSTLMGQLTRHTAADATVVALVGERGREVQEFHRGLGDEARARTVVVAATSDSPAALRMLAPCTAIAIAEDLRDRGLNVLLVVDSITRFALAGREVGITAGEPPSARGFPPSVFARLPLLLERLGRVGSGSITALLTVLVEGDRIEDDPIADALRGLLDGHILLSRDLAERGHYPAIDVPGSISRTMRDVVDDDHLTAAERVKVLCAALRRAEELREIGALRAGADPLLDEAVAKGEALRAFLIQGEAPRPYSETIGALAAIAHRKGAR